MKTHIIYVSFLQGPLIKYNCKTEIVFSSKPLDAPAPEIVNLHSSLFSKASFQNAKNIKLLQWIYIKTSALY